MLNENLFTNKKEFANQVEKSIMTLVNFNNDENRILKVDNLDETIKDTRHIFSRDDIMEVATTISNMEDKNVYLINETFDDNLKNSYNSIGDNFYRIFTDLARILPKYSDKKSKETSVSFLNIISPNIQDSEDISSLLFLPSPEIRNDISLLRSLEKVNVFVPADALEAEYLIKVSEKRFFKNIQNGFSYFRLTSSASPKIFLDNYFEKEGNLKEFTGMPEIIYISKHINAMFEVSIISCGPILSNVLEAARELENMGYKVTVLNMSFIQSNNKFINQKIESHILSFISSHKNILTVEEHSKVGGLGSLIAEIVAGSRDDKFVKVERLGLEDDLSPRNIIAKCEDIMSL